MHLRDEPVVILGFGRSGTTWISDIISKCTGQVVLFEPFHPVVFDASADLCYQINPKDFGNKVLNHLDDVFQKKYHDKWMLRNHLNSPTDELDNDFIDEVWQHITLIGFKSIRLSHSIQWLKDHVSTKIVFIIRHPLAVLASLMNRPRFWEEYGWKFHWEIFIQRTISKEDFNHNSKGYFKELSENLSSQLEKVAFMWAITHIISLDQLRQINVKPVYYEDFYLDPFGQSKSLLTSLTGASGPIHPSYLFTPSMTTLRTLHGAFKGKSKNEFPQFFWEQALTIDQVKTIWNLLETIAKHDHNLDRLLIERYSSSTFAL